MISKRLNTIGCCGIDCGLCPRFHSKSDSACPGCGGLKFKEKHPACGFVTCCAIKKGFEVCSECMEYPCGRFESEYSGYDSFVTHRKVFGNLDFIKSNGINSFIEEQIKRMEILVEFLEQYNDGRSASYFCVSCALIPLNKLQEIHSLINIQNNIIDIKQKSRLLKNSLQRMADDLKINLKLNVKKQIIAILFFL